MGAQGIRRRKPRRPLPDVPGMSPGDVGRLFGRFRWGAYTPAGNLERNGFFLRQLRRNGTDGAWAFFGPVKWLFGALAAGLVVFAIGNAILH